MTQRVLIVGGGAAGYFAALRVAELSEQISVVIAEAGKEPLQKVKISGGGRCNVTQACFDVRRLVQAYPRGGKELLGPFHRFQPADTVSWFDARGVELKTEEDGRMFPATDSSQTILDCFERSRNSLGVKLLLKTKVIKLSKKREGGYSVDFKQGTKTFSEVYDQVLLACGGAKSGHQLAKSLGHSIQPCVPSLFTFQVNDPRLDELSGVSVPTAAMKLTVEGHKPLSEKGPLLVTHWGFSGPAVIRLSAWAAKELAKSRYQAKLRINWVAGESIQQFESSLAKARAETPRKRVWKTPLVDLPKRLWENLCRFSQLGEELRFAQLSSKLVACLSEEVFGGQYQVSGKGIFKEEFVTCGGVSLKELNLKTMESKLAPGMFFAGEILDIDGITGGYNFQSAWTTGFIAGSSMGAG